MGYAVDLQCSRCQQTYPIDQLIGMCPCGGPLVTRYDLDRLRREVTPSIFGQRPPTMFRYRELLPLTDGSEPVTLGEGFTPLLPAPRFGAQAGLRNLWIKDEGVNPTGTFKARGAALGFTRLKELGANAVVLPTAGNAGGAWATYGARAGMSTVVYMPAIAPEINKAEVRLAGGELHVVDGLISDAGRLAMQAAKEKGYFDASTLKEPFRVEGKKTMGLEIAEQLGWRLPSAVLYPTGGGVGLIAMWKAFRELKELGWVEGPLPKMIVVQAEGCAPVVRAWQEGEPESTFWEGAATVASGLCVPKPLGDRLTLQAVRESGGVAIVVSDADIVNTMKSLGRLEGIVASPEGASAAAATVALRQQGVLGEDDLVVVLNTGSGLKYPHLVTG